MKIKDRLSIQFTLLVFVILIFFSFLVYYFSNSSQKSEFRKNLFDMAKNTAILLIDVEEVDSTLLNKIHKTTKSLDKEEITIYDSSGALIYSNQVQYLSGYKIAKIPENPGQEYFSIKEKDGIMYLYQAKGQTYQVYVLAYDTFKVENQSRLLKILFWSIISSILLSISVSYFFSRMAILPISKIVTEIKNINLSRLSKRLDEGKKKDEIEQLSINFNQMLSVLETAFKSQEEFISNASHELRTPLAIMIARSEYILSRDRNNLEYKQQMSELKVNLRNLNNLLNSLLELAHVNKENNTSISKIRIDEVIFNSIREVKQKHAGRKIIPRIEYSEDENDLLINGNPGFLEIAFKNLIENACKFSNGDVEVEISNINKNQIIRIIDHGIGIPENEIDNIFKPFSRATNANYYGGFGIGLSIVKKILDLHNAEIRIKSIQNKGTVFQIEFTKESFNSL